MAKRNFGLPGRRGKAWSFFVLVSLLALQASAEVTRIDVTSRGALPGNKSYGLAGAYEKLAGRIHFELDPLNPANQIIVDIDRAPLNASGKVEFSADFFLLKPRDVTRGNGTLLFGASNRGSKRLLTFFNHAQAEGRKWDEPDPAIEAHLGDGFLMQNGFTLLWVGWQFDPPMNGENLRAYLPAIEDRDRPIEGLARSDFVVTEKVFDFTLGDRNHIPYLVSDPQAPENILTVRDSVEAERQLIPRERWRFARLEGEVPVPDAGRVYLDSGFEPHKIYEVVYKTSNPTLIGLGPAGIRDIVSLLKYESAAALSIEPDTIRRAIGFGLSQPGRLLRTFLYQGFNVDEHERKVFDGVMAHIAGAGRGSFNLRFGQASRDAHAFLNFFYPTDIFPFTDVAQTDPVTGEKGGLLSHLAPEYLPRFFQTNSSYEYWGRAASLLHTTVDGAKDAPMMDNARIYHFAGGQHLPEKYPPPRKNGRQLNNPNDYSWTMRALLLAMNQWISDGSLPPPSRYPRIDDGTLVAPTDVSFPKLPGIDFPTKPHKAYRVDYGPDFASRGVIGKQPPDVGPAFPILVPQVDADGNETGGLRTPDIAVPLATYTGWNLYSSEYGPEDEIAHMSGSYIPFAATRELRESGSDPRPSIAERYTSREHYLGLVAKAALELADEGFLLDADLPEILLRALQHWDYLMSLAPGELDAPADEDVCTISRMGKDCGF
ncbi:MAG: alpha/beta hydrolase domain-containing protein [Gammaproteobacteria bacterium]|nr:alpha/beta hydrolase domain-containing protein [Gammaproteobacteria bacterium]